MLIVVGNALGFFKGSGSVIPFSVDLSEFCRIFRVESDAINKIYIGHGVLLINEVQNVIEKKQTFEILTTLWHGTIFMTQNRTNCRLCRIIRRDLGFIVVVHRFLQLEKFFNFDKVEHWVLIVSRNWWEKTPVVGYVGSWKKRAAVVGNDF